MENKSVLTAHKVSLVAKKTKDIRQVRGCKAKIIRNDYYTLLLWNVQSVEMFGYFRPWFPTEFFNILVYLLVILNPWKC